MLEECLEVFKRILEQEGESFILDEYIPTDGTYLIVELKKEEYFLHEPAVIKYDKKKNEVLGMAHSDYSILKFYEYSSRLIDMNKPMDAKKIIHSNNYLSFFIKKDSLKNGKLTKEVIDGYYDSLSNPEKKYAKNKKAKKIYELAETILSPINQEHLEMAKDWVMRYIFSLESLEENISIDGKDYLKIFFVFDNDLEAVKEEFDNERKRYLIPNIYNSNDFNIEGKELCGVPNDNMGLNAKKPYLEHRTRGITVPYLLNMETVMMQRKFFDYLYNQAAQNKLNVYIDIMENEMKAYTDSEFLNKRMDGLLLRLKKGKEVEIHLVEQVSGYHPVLEKPFVYKNYLQFSDDKDENPPRYTRYKKLVDISDLFNEVLFSKKLKLNYFTEASNLSIADNCLKESVLVSRNALYRWFRTGNASGVKEVLDKVSMRLVKNSLKKGYGFKATHQFNLRISMIEYFSEGEDSMAEKIEDIKEKIQKKINANRTDNIETDMEFYFAAGQAVKYLIRQSKVRNKTHALANPFLQEKSADGLKEKIRRAFIKYDYNLLSDGRRVNNLCAMIFQYTPVETAVNENMLLAGYLNSSLMKKEEE